MLEITYFKNTIIQHSKHNYINECFCFFSQINVDITIGGVRYQGTLVCPSCVEMCYVSLTYAKPVYLKY